MWLSDWVLLALFLSLLALLAKPLGIYIYKVLDPTEKTLLDPLLQPLEKRLYRWMGIDPTAEQGWKGYLLSLAAFSLICLLLTALILTVQRYLPFNPEKFNAPAWDLTLNTAMSFMTNTNWQSYSGEATLSYFSQMGALAVQNFVSPAVGLATAAVLVRGIARQSQATVGNFWVDIIRICLYLLLPLSILGAVFFLSQGTPQNFQSYVPALTVEGGILQKIAQGPIASQEAIKLLGSNGGGFMNVNSAHPYENPTQLANLLQLFFIFLIPVAQIYYFGYATKHRHHGWCIFAAVTILFVLGVWGCTHAERVGNPAFDAMGVMGGNWEGKEERFGIFGSSLYACATTAVACGAANASLDSFTPIGGLFPMLNMQLSDSIFGGMGAGLFNILLFVFLSIFISGLIIGRTPEYLGKKIEAFEIKMTMLAIIPFVLIVHALTSWACFSNWGLNALGNSGPHGFSEMLYAFTSCSANNGSAFAGLNSNTLGYNLTLASAMALGRFLMIAPVIAIGGSFAKKKLLPVTASSFPVNSLLFIFLLIGVIVLIGALTFFPALTMGPIIEQFFMQQGDLSP